MADLNEKQIKRYIFWLQYPSSCYEVLKFVFVPIVIVIIGLAWALKLHTYFSDRELFSFTLLGTIILICAVIIFLIYRRFSLVSRDYELRAYVLSPNSKHRRAWCLYALCRKSDHRILGYSEGHYGVERVPFVPVRACDGYSFRVDNIEHLGKPRSAKITICLKAVVQEQILCVVLDAGVPWLEWQKQDYEKWVAAGQRATMVHLDGSKLDDCKSMGEAIQAELAHDVASGHLVSLREVKNVTVEIVSSDPSPAMPIHRV